MKTIIINYLYKLFLATSIVFLLLSVYLNISKMDSEDTISINFQTMPKGHISPTTGRPEMYDEKIAKIDNLNDLKKLVDYEIKENNFEGIDIPVYIDNTVRRKYFCVT